MNIKMRIERVAAGVAPPLGRPRIRTPEAAARCAAVTHDDPHKGHHRCRAKGKIWDRGRRWCRRHTPSAMDKLYQDALKKLKFLDTKPRQRKPPQRVKEIAVTLRNPAQPCDSPAVVLRSTTQPCDSPAASLRNPADGSGSGLGEERSNKEKEKVNQKESAGEKENSA